MRYQQGQELIVEESKTDPDPVTPQIVTQTKLPDKKIKEKPSNTKAAAKSVPVTKSNMQTSNNMIQRLPPAKALIASHETSQSPNLSEKTHHKESPQPALKLVFRKLSSLPKPQQGDAQVKSCGCFGTRHDVTVNCLYCGRISCSAELNIFFCPSCRYQLHEITDPVRMEWYVLTRRARMQ